MSHVRMFVIILLVSAVATVYGQERHGTETGTAQLSIYKLPPLERAIRCTKYYGYCFKECVWRRINKKVYRFFRFV